MPIPTTYAQGELEAINEILASVGQAPVTTLDQTNPDVAIAYDTLQQVSREVQAEGWTFNKEYDVTLTPDNNKNISLPETYLQVDLSPEHREQDAVRREGKLYDRMNHTYEWDKPVKCDITYQLAYEDLPPPVRSYIVARSASITSTRIVGDGTQFQMLQQREAYARAVAMEYECNQGDFSFFGHPRGGSFYNSYEPYKALAR